VVSLSEGGQSDRWAVSVVAEYASKLGQQRLSAKRQGGVNTTPCEIESVRSKTMIKRRVGPRTMRLVRAA
jgi:hypothetical protein